MKNFNIILLTLALIGGLTACNDQLNVENPNIRFWRFGV